jgi:hypothetical protein
MPARPSVRTAEASRDVCTCCGADDETLTHDLRAWWRPSPGYGYGPDGQFITLCSTCIWTLQSFVEAWLNDHSRPR